MNDCVFCKIIKGKKETDMVLETDELIIFPDINPHAPIHLLIVPKKHTQDVTEVDDETWKMIKDVAVRLAKERELEGFRLVTNAGDAALVPHLHVHFMAGVGADDKL
jgi:histidine triad (HIT) family protein